MGTGFNGIIIGDSKLIKIDVVNFLLDGSDFWLPIVRPAHAIEQARSHRTAHDGRHLQQQSQPAAQHSGSKRPRDDAPVPQKLQSLRAEKRAERDAVLLALGPGADEGRGRSPVAPRDDGADPSPRRQGGPATNVFSRCSKARRASASALTVSQLKARRAWAPASVRRPSSSSFARSGRPPKRARRRRYGVDNHAPTEERDGVMSPGR